MDFSTTVPLLISLVTAGYLAYDKIVRTNAEKDVIREQADQTQAEALSTTAQTAQYFMTMSKEQVELNKAEIQALRIEIRELRARVSEMSSRLSGALAENKVLREMNEWLQTQLITLATGNMENSKDTNNGPQIPALIIQTTPKSS